MATMVLGELPELTDVLERRRELGQDGHDEVWEGVYYATPHANARHAWLQATLIMSLGPLVKAKGYQITVEFNLGEGRNDYRVPDLGVHAGLPSDLYLPTAVAVVEVLSPDDKSLEKLTFYATHEVDEVIIVDPDARTVTNRHRVGAGYEVHDLIECAGITGAELAAMVDWF